MLRCAGSVDCRRYSIASWSLSSDSGVSSTGNVWRLGVKVVVRGAGLERVGGGEVATFGFQPALTVALTQEIRRLLIEDIGLPAAGANSHQNRRGGQKTLLENGSAGGGGMKRSCRAQLLLLDGVLKVLVGVATLLVGL
ncbi:hypothetical protein EYF80_001028 [Liparis tanakae]|uniref:Uncharacterized protein n=1 Tax=Liparis tanakae TaxID=230148 RepID=A0A4Z2JEM6_9TELE|nr:hypothetical protein EYF80_001028 [Liparis tanakae]